MKKRYFSFLLCAFLVGILTGCGQKTTVNTTEGETTTASSVTSTETQKEPELPAVTRLSCVTPGYNPKFWGTGDGTLYCSYAVYDEAAARLQTHLYHIDYSKDVILQSLELEGNYEFVEQGFTDGSILLRECGEQWGFYHFDNELNEMERFEAPADIYGVFDHELTRYYYIEDRILYAQDLDTGNRTKVSFDMDLRFSYIAGIHPEKNLISLQALKFPYESWEGWACAADLDSGKVVMLADWETPVSLFEDNFYTVEYDSDGTYEMIYGSVFGEEPLKKVSCDVFAAETESPFPFKNAPSYLLSGKEDKLTKLTCLGDTVMQYRFSDNDCSLYLWDIVRMPEGLLAGFEQKNENETAIVLVNPAKLDFQVLGKPEEAARPEMLDKELAEQYQRILEGEPVAEPLKEVRAAADQLEEEFGVTIYISNQCEIPCSIQNSYTVQTTDKANLPNEAETITQALERLREILERYPNGFFRQFQNKAGERGLMILLTGAIGEEVPVGGLSFYLGQDWYPIMIDISHGMTPGTLCHELWHATEERINTLGVWFDDNEWAAFNPPEFTYANGTAGFEELREWTAFGDLIENCYFVDSYARVNEREDRARLMEYAMEPDYGYMADDIFPAAPRLRQKLAYMSRKIREVFDTTGWENVRWERYESRDQ